ncbi:MAG: AAA family ATPase, partial [Patescibacteria group bacterium]
MAKNAVTYLDLAGKSKTTTWDEVFRATNAVKAFFTELCGRFVERDQVAEAVKYALMIREHVLIHGPGGSAKTAVADTVIQGIQDAQIWSMDFSKFMGESRVFGDFDVKHAQETGELRHLIRGSLVEANFANLGEFSDASMELQRALMRVLNERQFIRGPQKLKVPLITAVANTNFDPLQERARHMGFEAVLDRFMFWVRVVYVEKPENEMEMLDIFLERKQDRPLPPLKLDDIVMASGVVLGMNLLTNLYVKQAFRELRSAFVAARGGRRMSDRRWLKSAQILEASAILNGKTEADFDDLRPLSLVWCESPDEEKHFIKAYDDVVAKWRSDQHKQVVDAEIKLLDDYAGTVPDSAVINAYDLPAVFMARRRLNDMTKAVQQAITTSPASSKKKSDVLVSLELA